MTLLNDTEKVEYMIRTLDRHIKQIHSEDACTKDSINQKAAISNSEIFIDNLAYYLSDRITAKRAVGTLIASLSKVGYLEAMDAAAIILEFERLLGQLPLEEAENICKERWET